MKTFLDFLADVKQYTIQKIETSEETLRDQYVSNSIFKEGSLVEQISTGKVGTVMRRGANYLICLTDDGNLFKPWITDTKEI